MRRPLVAEWATVQALTFSFSILTLSRRVRELAITTDMKQFFVFLSFFCLFCSQMVAKLPTTDYRNALILAYSPVNSVYEDDNIRLEIYAEQLWASNKTSKTIFIDRSQCFLVNNGSSFPMWSEKQNEKSASKKGSTTSIDEFITIAPATGGKQNETFICNMTTNLYGQYSSSESPSGNFSDYDIRMLTIIDELARESLKGDSKGKKFLGTATRHLTEDESISTLGANIAYAFNKRAEDWTTVALSTWVSDVILTPLYLEMPDEKKNNDQQGFGVKQSTPAKLHVKANSPFEFDEDKSPVIVADWEGNFKKGTFNLKPIRVAKNNIKNKGLISFLTLGLGTALYDPIFDTNYKSVVSWDGPDAYWGSMTYTYDVMQTRFKK